MPRVSRSPSLRGLAVLLAASLVVLACDGPAAPTPVAGGDCAPIELLGPDGRAIDISGAWSANDGGVYYIKQIDSCVWWSGLSDFEGQEAGDEWVMAFRGTLDSSGILHGVFVDVKGTNPGTGTMTIRVQTQDVDGVLVTELHREASTGHTIGVTFWQRRASPSAPDTEPTELPTPAETALPDDSPPGSPEPTGEAAPSPDEGAPALTLPPG
jgi:hypothetical protein